MLYYSTKRLFNWLFSLFDWIYPTPPVEPSWKVWKWGGNTYDSRPINPNIFSSGSMNNYTVPKMESSNWSTLPRSIYYNLTGNNSNSWTNTLYNILWYTGIVVVTLGVGFVAYSIYTDPGIVTKHIPFRSNNNPNINNMANQPDIEINDNRTNPSAQAGSWLFDATRGLYEGYKGMLNILNPFYWLSGNTTNVDWDTYMASQSNPNTYNKHFYPFTNNNPHDSWLTKLRITVFGESDTERLLRENRLSRVHQSIKEFIHGVDSDSSFEPENTKVKEKLEGTSYLRQSVAGTGVNTPIHGNIPGEAANEIRIKNLFDTAFPEGSSEWSDRSSSGSSTITTYNYRKHTLPATPKLD